MAPKQAGRHVSTQLEREAQGLKWKSASTIDRQRAQKKNRKQKKRQRKQMAETADWQNPPTPPTGPRAEASGRGQPDRSGQALPGDQGTSPIGLRSPTPQGDSDSESSGVEGGGLASGAEAPHPRRSPRPAPEQPAPETGVVLRSRSPTRHSSAEAPGPGGSPQDSSESSATPEVVLEGQDVTHRRPLPFPVGLTGVQAGAEPPGNVVARFFPERLLMILDLATQRPMEPLALRLLKAGKSRAVYDLIPPRDFVYKVALEGGHGAEAEVARSLPQLAPETFSYPRVMLKLYWEREDTDYLLLCEVLWQRKVQPLCDRWPGTIPAPLVLHAAVVVAHASRYWRLKDLGAYNLFVRTSGRGYMVGFLDMADWTEWPGDHRVYPGKQRSRGLLTCAGQREVLRGILESLGGRSPDEAIACLRPHLSEQSVHILQDQGIL